jgi:hypothetical protein
MVESHQKSEGPPGGTLAFSIHQRGDGAERGVGSRPHHTRPAYPVGGGCFGRRGVFQRGGGYSACGGGFSTERPGQRALNRAA